MCIRDRLLPCLFICNCSVPSQSLLFFFGGVFCCIFLPVTVFFPQLTTGPIDIPAHFSSNSNINSIFFKFIFEILYYFFVRLYKIPFLDVYKRQDKNRDPEEYLSVYYSVPQWLVKRWVQTYGTETTECMLKDFLTDHPLTDVYKRQDQRKEISDG